MQQVATLASYNVHYVSTITCCTHYMLYENKQIYIYILQ